MQLLLLLVLLQCAPNFGWSTEGHQIVAQIADDYLTHKTKTAIKPFLNGKTLSEISTLPDPYRSTSQGKWTAPCHYVNLPSNAQHYQASYCGEYCVVESVYNYTNILSKNPHVCDYSKGVEPCALEFLTHYVGDIHQPLHAGWASDKGGNAVDVYYYNTLTNLHSVWDHNIITQWNPNVQSAVAELESNITTEEIKKITESMDASDWADESFQYVRTVVYEFTTYKNGDPWLQGPYFDQQLPVIKYRLTAGGIRLAQLLNTIFDPNSFHHYF